MTPAPVETFRTDGVPIPRRLNYWNEVAVTTFGDIAIDAASTDFAARMERSRFGELTLANIFSTPARVYGGGREHSGNVADGWFLLLNERGFGRFAQRGREVCLQPGQLTALRADEEYRIEFSKANQTLVLYLPCDPRGVDFDRHIAKSHNVDDASLLLAFMRRLAVTDSASDEWESLSYTRLALDLATLTWPAIAAAPSRRSMAHWRRRAFDLVARRLDEPELSAQLMARELAVSPRFVQLVFASCGHTVSAYILECRLELAALRLRQNRTASISEIALSVGFNDLSHFCRRFRQRFGVSARQFRCD